MRVGVDTGGTFTDVVTEQGVVRKLLSTPADPSRAVLDACDVLVRAGRSVAVLAHGTTVATNALLERRLGRVALVTTRGFADVIEIARQARPSLYDAHVDRPTPLVPRALRFEVGGRLDAHGARARAVRRRGPRRRRGGRGGGVPAPRRPRPQPRTRGGRRAPRGAVTRSCARTRCRPSSASTSGSSPRSPTRRSARCARRTSAASVLLADDVLVMTSAGGLVPLDRGRRPPGAAVVVGPGRRRAGRGRDRRARAVSPTRSRSTWVAPAPTCAWCRTAFRHPRPRRHVAGLPVRLPSLADPHHRRRWRVGGAPRSGRRTRSRTRERRRRTGTRLLRTRRHRGDRHRRRPGARAASRRARSSPASGDSTSPPLAPRSTVPA